MGEEVQPQYVLEQVLFPLREHSQGHLGLLVSGAQNAGRDEREAQRVQSVQEVCFACAAAGLLAAFSAGWEDGALGRVSTDEEHADSSLLRSRVLYSNWVRTTSQLVINLIIYDIQFRGIGIAYEAEHKYLSGNSVI